jgi:hypothetical protein
MTEEQFRQMAIERFGEDHMGWKFVCPSCGFVQSVRDYKDAGAPETAVAFSCVGRWRKDCREAFPRKKDGRKPCNYAGGGLIGMNPVRLDDRKGNYFELAPTVSEPESGEQR